MYHSEAKIVFTGEGRSFKYEFDCRSARIPAFAAVSPNRETGPKNMSFKLQYGFLEHTLNKSSADALIISPHSTIMVECFGGSSKSSSKSVLVIHNGSKWLEKN